MFHLFHPNNLLLNLLQLDLLLLDLLTIPVDVDLVGKVRNARMVNVVLNMDGVVGKRGQIVLGATIQNVQWVQSVQRV